MVEYHILEEKNRKTIEKFIRSKKTLYTSINKKRDKLVIELNKLVKEYDLINADSERILKLRRQIEQIRDQLDTTENIINYLNFGLLPIEHEYIIQIYEILFYYETAQNKKDVIDEFHKCVDLASYVKTYKPKRKKCSHCGSVKLGSVSPGTYMCQVCLNTDEYYDENVSNRISEITNTVRNNSYQKIIYYNEYMDRFRARKIPLISDEVFTLLKDAIRKDGITNYKDLTPSQIDKFLKKIGHPEYYYDKIYILNKLNNLVPPSIKHDDLERMQLMFREIESVWLEHKPREQISFMPYPYCIRKILELLEYDEYLKYWKLSSSQENIRRHDKIWEKLCEKLKYQYIPTYKFN